MVRGSGRWLLGGKTPELHLVTGHGGCRAYYLTLILDLSLTSWLYALNRCVSLIYLTT